MDAPRAAARTLLTLRRPLELLSGDRVRGRPLLDLRGGKATARVAEVEPREQTPPAMKAVMARGAPTQPRSRRGSGQTGLARSGGAPIDQVWLVREPESDDNERGSRRVTACEPRPYGRVANRDPHPAH
jgi:hypothetical protein